MTVRLNQLYAQYAHRREVENHRVERKHELNRYYDHWDKVTTRHDNWSNPDYYEAADRKLQARKEKTEKDQRMIQRRDQMRALFKSEAALYESEVAQRNRSRFHRPPDNIETLNRICQASKEREQMKRKLEMEAKLYGRWRHGVDDDGSLLFNNNSDHKVLAKLSWLDKQIDNQVQREQDEREAQERNLRLQEELNKAEEILKERQQIREQEIKEINAMQDRHMEEMKLAQEQADKLKDEEKHLRVFLSEIEHERELLEESNAVALKRPDSHDAFNLKKIKIFIRNRSENVRKQIKISINIVERILEFCIQREKFAALLKQCQDQLEAEVLAYEQIETLYESEAKQTLHNCEELWRDQHIKRYNEIRKLVDNEFDMLSEMIEENVRQQQENFELRSSHLAAMEIANQNLKRLCHEHEQALQDGASIVDDSGATGGGDGDTASIATIQKRGGDSDNDTLEPKMTNSFANLNLDCISQMPMSRSDLDAERLSKTRSMNVVNKDTAAPPMFGRKRVAWT